MAPVAKLPTYKNYSSPVKAMTIDQVDADSNDSIVNFVIGRWQRRDQHRQAIERQWYINIAQYLGYQYHQLDTYSGTLVLPPAPPYRVRLVCNRLMPIVRKVVSKLLRTKPTWVVIPATSEQEDLYTAKVASKLLSYYWRHSNLDRLVVNAATWMGCTGNVFMRVVWDPTCGPELSLSPEDIIDMPPQLQKIAKEGINIGDLQFDMITPFEIDPDPDAQYLEEASHLIHTRARSPIYLDQRYGTLASGLQPDANASDNLGRYYTRRIQSLIGPSGAGPTKNEDEESVAVLTHSLWIRPCKRHPKGLHAVVAGDRVLQKGAFQKGLDEIPYVHLLEIPVPGRFWGTCALEQCIPLQADYNRGRSQLCENRNLMSKPKWLVPKGSGISDSACTSEPGELIFHTPGLAPVAWVPPPMPDFPMKILEYDLKDMEDGSAQHEVCVSEDAEALTATGWKTHDQIRLGDTILTYNVETGKSEWQPVLEMTRYRGCKEVYHLYNSKSFDFLVTGNHRWPVTSKRGVRKIAKTVDLSTDMSIPRQAELEEPERNQVYTDSMSKLIAWHITEGSFCVEKAGPLLRISQSEEYNDANCEKIAALLDEEIGEDNYSANRQKDGCVQFAMRRQHALKIQALVPDKKLTPGIVMNLTQEQRGLMIETLLDGDGCREGVTPRFATTEKETADAFQMLLALSGKNGRICRYDRSAKQKPIYLISVRNQTQTSVIDLTVKKEPYSGIVWCPTTANMTWFMRRNGHVTFTGNTQARAPSGLRSGVAIAQLQEQDEQMLAPTFLAFEKALSKIGSLSLKLLANNATEDRIINIVGRNNEVETITFTGGSLLGKSNEPGANYYDVECQMGSQLPLSKEQRMNYIVQLINARILDPMADKKKIMQLLDLGTEEPLMGDDQLQRQNARRENMQMMQLIQIAPMPWDDDAIHWEEHNRFELQPEFQKNAIPEIIQIIEAHKELHVLNLAGTMPDANAPQEQGQPQSQGGMPPMPQGEMESPAEPYPTEAGPFANT